MQLPGSHQKQLSAILIDALGADLEQFDQMLLFYMNLHRQQIALGSSLDAIIFRTMQWINARNRMHELIMAARAFNSDNSQLFAFAQEFGLAIATPPRPALEKIVVETNSHLDVSTWRTKLARLENQVCRVEISAGLSEIRGTGFLLGPNALMTNYHVVEKVMKEKGLHNNVVIRFDYKELADGTISQGTTFKLATDWLIDASPYSPVDDNADLHEAVPQPDQLDYALMRVDGNPGGSPIGLTAKADLPQRGWIQAPTTPCAFEAHTPLFILQHPAGKPLKLALNTDAILEKGINCNGTRVRYMTNTESGSSGAPCFDQDWNLVALHHLGDPSYKAPKFNQGVPFSAIIALLTTRGKASALGQQVL